MKIRVPAALDLAGARAFADGVTSAAGDPTCRMISIEGGDGEFCRGLDFASIVAANGDVASGMAAFVRCLRAIREAGVPVIAVVDGPALGGGLGIAAACDVIIATPRATFGLPEALFGLIPAAVMPLLLERIPAQKARLWAMTARSRTAAEACAVGLVDVLLPSEAQASIESALKKWERQLRRANPDAIRALKGSSPQLFEAVEQGAAQTARMLAGGRIAEHLRSFLAGEPAPWMD